MSLEGAAERVKAAFERNLASGADVGAAVAAWKDGESLFSYAHGWRDAGRTMPWTTDTLVLVWSATKGLASACALKALDEAHLDLANRMTDFWPEFGANGKSELTVGDVLSHRAGLAALADKSVQLLDHDGVARAIAAQAPLWEAGKGHGYGPRTFGFIADEIVRRLAGKTLGNFWREEFAEPMGLDAWIGLPESEHGRVAQMLPPRAGCGDAEDAFAEAMTQVDSITRRAFMTPASMVSPSGMNAPTMRSASIPSMGGIASATALAKFYAMLASGGVWRERRYVSGHVLEWMTTQLTHGKDKTLQTETAFSAGFMMDPLEHGKKKRHLYGPSVRAFGHPGAGGSLAFADPENGVGFAYVMNQMELGVLPKARAVALVQALYDFP